MSIRAYPSVKKLEQRFPDASKPVELFYLIASDCEAASLRRQLESAARRGGASVRFFAAVDQLFIGEGTQPWTYAALLQFSRTKALIGVAREDGVTIDAARLAIYPIRELLPPVPVQAALGALRLFGKLVDTGDADLGRAILGAQRDDVMPSAEQLAVRVSDTRECPIYCINFLSYRERADYVDGRPSTLSGSRAYRLYGLRAIAAVRALGGRALFGGRSGEPLTDGDDSAVAGCWDDIVIVRYPTPRTILKLDRLPWYRGGHVHRDAGLERTALLVASDPN
jgi:hypothetical protein